jgi:hypothetical protein
VDGIILGTKGLVLKEKLSFMDTNFQYKSTVELTDPEEVKFWKRKWNVSSQQLVGAIKATGTNSVLIIDEYLFNRKTRNRRPRFITQL